MSWVEDLIKDAAASVMSGATAQPGRQRLGQAAPTALERAMRSVYRSAGMSGPSVSDGFRERFHGNRERYLQQLFAQLVDEGAMSPGSYAEMSSMITQGAQQGGLPADMPYVVDNFRFGGGQGSSSAAAAARRTDPIIYLLGVKRSEAARIIRELPDDQFVMLQMRLYQAGYYEDRPSFGMRTEAESRALDALMYDALSNPDKSIVQVVNEATETRLRNLSAELGLDQADDDGINPDDVDVLSVQSVETYEDLLDRVSGDLIGMSLDTATRRQMAEELRAKELASKRQLSRIDRALRGPNERTGVDNPELQAFMEAIGIQESGGNYDARNGDSGASGKYQIMPSNWPSWAKMAGLPSNAPQTPENQDRVARTIMTMYYNQFGNWRDVAIAWYAGPGKVRTRSGLNASQGDYPTINAYADRIISRQNEILGQQGMDLQSMIDPVTGEIIVEDFDPTSEADRAIRAAKSQEMLTYGFASQAREFFSLLGGVV